MLPTTEEIRACLQGIISHVCNFEYYLALLNMAEDDAFFQAESKERELSSGEYRILLNLGKQDPERPHDIVGSGNKFQWEVLQGLALQYRNGGNLVGKERLTLALAYHRQQYHHQKWNFSNPADHKKPHPASTSQDMMIGALDTICSLRENRDYQGGAHTWDQIQKICSQQNEAYRVSWLLQMLSLLKILPEPPLHKINGVYDIPNIGLPTDIYQRICQRVQDVMADLNGRGYYF